MPVDMSGLSDADKQDYEHRLSLYGLDGTTLLQEELLIPPSSRVYLAMAPNSFIQPRVLETKDLSTVKQWIGIPDVVFERIGRLPRVALPTTGRLPHAPPSPIETESPGNVRITGRPHGRESAKHVDLSQLESTDFDNIRAAARAYVRGNSTVVSAFKPIIESHFEIFQVAIWPFLRVKVPRGSVLEYGPGAHVLVAHEVEIEEGGIIRSRGHLTVNCTVMKKP